LLLFYPKEAVVMNPWFLLQAPVPGSVGVTDLGDFVLRVIFTMLWAVVAAFAFGVAIPLAMLIFDQLTPGIDEFAELKRGNMAVAVVLASFILGIALIVAAVMVRT
jgi:RsiW-degrading membrane proteinase PrsW (M82 family)